jgi:hypothetical protein
MYLYINVLNYVLVSLEIISPNTNIINLSISSSSQRKFKVFLEKLITLEFQGLD